MGFNLDNTQNTLAVPYGIQVARGAFPTLSSIDKFGYLPTSSGSFQTVWDGGSTYAYPASALVMTVTSAAGATDNGVEVTVIGLDSDWLPKTQTVTLAGSGTATTEAFIRVFRAYVSNGQAATGQITVANGGVNYAIITVANQQTLMCVYTIPEGKRGYLVAANISVEKAQNVVAKLMVRQYGGVIRSQGIVTTFGVPFQRVWQIPPVFGSKTDIEIRATAGATTSIAAGFEILLEDD